MYQFSNTHFIKLSLVFFISFSLFSCADEVEKVNYPETDLSVANLIPIPLHIEASNSGFGLDENTVITTSEAELDDVANTLKENIDWQSNLSLSVNPEKVKASQRKIALNLIPDLTTTSEAYHLRIEENIISIDASTAEGAFRGIQTLRQLIPANSNDTLASKPMWIIPSGYIEDEPNLEYRGTMLDVSRHFFDVDEVKKYIDAIALYKFNTLHLHLSDDQGWRIEIKSWPKLTEVGGSTEVGGGDGGFYTQEDYKEIIAYAAKHFITIVPEIDMPGHTNAASVAYPFLNGNGKTLELYTGIEVGFSTFDTRKDSVYAFIDDVVREITELSPGPYFHIGGDESHSTEKDDYIYFVSKVDEIVAKYGKQSIGWDEIATADIRTNSIPQFWASKENAETAIEKGMKILMSPAKKAYVDMKYSDTTKLGLQWAAIIPVNDAYNWHPVGYEGIGKEHILGIEAPFWAETADLFSEAEYLIFPRLLGMSELGWSSKEKQDWDNYKVRLANHARFLNKMDINFYRSNLVDWVE